MNISHDGSMGRTVNLPTFVNIGKYKEGKFLLFFGKHMDCQYLPILLDFKENVGNISPMDMDGLDLVLQSC